MRAEPRPRRQALPSGRRPDGGAVARLLSTLLLLLAVLTPTAGVRAQGTGGAGPLYRWEGLPDLPDTLGVAGPCVGASGGALIVAGGANFPVPLFEGGPKVWSDAIHVLTPAGGAAAIWQDGGRLPVARGYAAALTVGDEVLCIGGGNAGEHFADVLSLRFEGGRVVQSQRLPPLPEPVAFASAARSGDTVYVAGGLSVPGDTHALRSFRALDLSDPAGGWVELPPWPGPGRYDAVMGTIDGAVYLVSGVEPVAGEDGTVAYRFLTDAYRYRPGAGWDRVADLPWAVAAAPSPARAYGPSHLLVFGGNDGALVPRVRELGDRHPGFRREVLAYHTITDSWAVVDTLPAARVNTPLTEWAGRLVLASGEVRPGTRSPEVRAAGSRAGESRSNVFGWLDYLVLAGYFVGLAGMGAYFAGRGRSDDDFFLSGGRIPGWAAGVSIFGTQLSAITFMAIPAKAYATDWVYILGQATIVMIAPVVVFLYLPFFRRLEVKTAYEYLERRFNLAVRLFGSLAFILLQLGRMAIVILLPALALAAATGFNLYLSILLMGVVTTLYSAAGGIEAVVWTDVVQVVVLLGGAFLSLVLIVTSVDGGLPALMEIAASEGKFHTFTWTWDYTTTAVWVVLLGNLLGNLVPYTADQAVVQRYLTTRDERGAARSIWTNAILTIPAAFIFFGLGTALFVFYRQHPGRLDPSLSTDTIFPHFIVSELPAGIAGLLIAGIFAAAMSTLSSSMNSIGSAITTDFYRRLVPGTTDRGRLRLARAITVLLGLVGTGGALWLASFQVGSLWDVFVEMLGLFGGGLAGLFALGIFTRRANGPGALTGALLSALILYLVKVFTPVHFFLYGAIGIVSCVVLGYLASLVLGAPPGSVEGLTIHSLRSSRGEAAIPRRSRRTRAPAST